MISFFTPKKHQKNKRQKLLYYRLTTLNLFVPCMTETTQECSKKSASFTRRMPLPDGGINMFQRSEAIFAFDRPQESEIEIERNKTKRNARMIEHYHDLAYRS